MLLPPCHQTFLSFQIKLYGQRCKHCIYHLPRLGKHIDLRHKSDDLLALLRGDLQQRRLRPVADARRSCWGSGQQDASATQGTRRMLGAATRNSKQQPTGLIACGAVRRRLVRAPSIVQTPRKTSTQRVLVFLGAVKQSKSEPFPSDATSVASLKVTVCVPSL